MNNPKEITRVLFESFQPQAIHLFYAIGYVAIAIFTYGVYVQIRKYRRGAPDGSWGQLLNRFIDMVKTMATHRTLVRRDKSAGRAHVLIFLGFVLLFIGTSFITLQYDILQPLFGIEFWYGNFYLLFSLVLAGVMRIGPMI